MQKKTYYYGSTVTFHSHYDYMQKRRLIENLPKYLIEFIRPTTSGYTLRISIEYHKVENKDDYEAPHVHFILETPKRLPKYIFTPLLKYLSERCGRTQLFLMTDMKRESYEKYIQKDKVRLKEELGWEHYYELVLTTVDHPDPDLILWSDTDN